MSKDRQEGPPGPCDTLQILADLSKEPGPGKRPMANGRGAGDVARGRAPQRVLALASGTAAAAHGS